MGKKSCSPYPTPHSDQVLSSIEHFLAWLNAHGYEGWDPYDIKEQRWYIYLKNAKHPILTYARKYPFKFIDCFPTFSRHLLRVPKRINNKGLGLFANGFATLFQETQDQRYLDQAEALASTLMKKNAYKDSDYFGIGYPFNWQSSIYIPKNTPLSVVTIPAGHAFLTLYHLTKKDIYLDYVKKTANFITQKLNVSFEDDSSMCLSYGVLDDYQVNNATLFSGAYLIRASAYLGETEKQIAQKILQFVMNEQQDDGSWMYWGKRQQERSIIDHYHTAVTLEYIGDYLGFNPQDFTFKDQLESGLSFYLDHLFSNDYEAKMTNSQCYPIDIHSITQAIVSLSGLHKHGIAQETVVPYITQSLARLIQEFQDKGGHFYYRKHGRRFTTIPYIRWGQGWSFLALSRGLSCLNRIGTNKDKP